MSTPWRIVLSVLAVALSFYYVSTDEPKLGLDLEGGTQVVLDLKAREGQEITSSTAEETVEVLRRRVDSIGVAEPNLEVSGDSRVIVELPGETDRERAISVIGRTAQLTFHAVEANLGAAQQQAQPGALPTDPTVSPSDPNAAPPSTAAPASPSTTSAGLGENTATQTLGQAEQTPATTAAPATPPATPPAGEQPPAATGSPLVLPSTDGSMLQLAPEALNGDGVGDATAQPPDQTNAAWYIQIEFKGDGQNKWFDLTGQAACNPVGDPKRQVAIVLDQQVISHPQVSGDGSSDVACGRGISGDKTVITGGFTEDQAKNLALLIRGGALPVDVELASTQVVGPELGDEAIDDSIKAVVVGGILTILYILFYYRLMGVLASIALAAYALVSYAVLLALDLTLTLPGIAGFVLAIAMATDSNILVYERAKEELDAGRSMKQSGRIGFKNALSAIIDSNATTFIAAATLFVVAVGEVKGFAVTLLVGTAVSIFITLILLRTLVTGLLAMNWASNRPRLLGMTVGKRFRDRLVHNPPNVMKLSKGFLAFATIITLLALSGLAFRGINYGIEFSGGRLLEYTTTQTVNVDNARDKMGELGFDDAVVQRSGTDDTSVRVGDVTPEQITQINDAMKELGGGEATTLRDETVSGSFSDELKRKAIIGLIFGIGLQLVWVAFRFRWTFGLGAVLAMLHDGLLVFGLWAWLQKPFDAVFLAAMLTIIAFSVTDSVVVFDRIRENLRRKGGAHFETVVNNACVQTFPRTLNISISAIFILITLYIFGGQTLSDFALALIIGIITGVYSSVFIASTIAIYLERWRPSVSGGRMSGGKFRGPKNSGSGATLASDGEPNEVEEEVPAGAVRPAPRPRKKAKKKR